MSIRDVIEAASGYTIVADVESSTTNDSEGDAALTRFIRTFDPTHVALMERVIFAAAWVNAAPRRSRAELTAAIRALVAHRAERGL